MSDYVRKYRSLASTYVEFSPDGTELLTNMGGEQIYLFPLQSDLREDCTTFTIPRLSSAEGKAEVGILIWNFMIIPSEFSLTRLIFEFFRRVSEASDCEWIREWIQKRKRRSV